jgi:hypothetical protein
MEMSVPDIISPLLKTPPSIGRFDNGDCTFCSGTTTVSKLPAITTRGDFTSVVLSRAWLSFKRAGVCKQNDEVVVVIDWTPAVLRNWELQRALQENSL